MLISKYLPVLPTYIVFWVVILNYLIIGWGVFLFKINLKLNEKYIKK